MNICRNTQVIIITACTIFVGCGSFSKPTAEIIGVKIVDFGLQDLTLQFDSKITNPNVMKIPLVNLDYSLASGGRQFLSGDAPLQGFVPANGTKVVPLKAKVGFASLLKVLSGFRPGSVVPYEGALGLSVDVPLAGKLRLPLKNSGSIPIPAVPSVEITEIKWDKLTFTRAGGKIRLKLTNRCDYPVSMKDVGFNLILADADVGRFGTVREVRCQPNAPSEIELDLGVSPADIGLAAFNILRGKGASYKLKGAMKMDTEYGSLDIPLDKVGKTLFSSD